MQAQDLSSRSELGQGSLLEEARILQSISHPNIVYIERVFDEDPAPNKGRLFIVQVRPSVVSERYLL